MIVPAPDFTDEALAARAAAGDDTAFQTLVARYQHRVFRLACRLAGETDAPDVLQDTFLQVFRHFPEFRGDSRFSTWLYRIATNAGLMHRRARRRRPAESLDAFLPRFEADGTLAQIPEALRMASRVDELLDRHTLANRAQSRHRTSAGFVSGSLRAARSGGAVDSRRGTGARCVARPSPAQRVHRARLMVRGYLERARGSGAMKDITCISGVELLMEYLEGELPADVRAAVDAHVAGCPRCEAFIEK